MDLDAHARSLGYADYEEAKQVLGFDPAPHWQKHGAVRAAYPVINGEAAREVTATMYPEAIKERFNRGDRDINATAPAYMLGWIEPAIPWEGGEIVWRPTELGKKAGLK